MAVDNKSSQVIVNEGLVNNVDICRLFNITDKTVRARLRSLQPVVRKGLSSYYNIVDVMPLLVKPKNVGDYIKTMSFHDLPKDLSKEYWAGQKSKQDYELKAGDLWPTNQVIERVGDAFKVVTMEIRLMADHVSRTNGLTPEQRATFEQLTDETLKRIQKTLAEKFKPRPMASSPIEDGEIEAMETVADEDDDEL